MNWFIWLLIAAGIALFGLYFLFPARLVNLVIGLARKWGRLSANSVIVDGVTWPYLEGGPVDGDTVVMLHGFGGDKNNWILYARYFTKRFRVIAPDLPGFGENVRNPDWDHGGVAQTERLHAFMGELGVDSFHLAGNSMGGYIALHYALTYPNQLKTLTLIDNAGVTSKHKSELELAVKEGTNPLVASSLDDFDRLLKFVMHKRIPSPRFMMQAMLEIHIRHFDFLNEVFWALTDEVQNHNVTERLGDVAMPTLIIWGRHDRLIDVSCTEVMAAAIPDNEVVILEDVGHVPMVESPKVTAGHHIDLITGAESHAGGG
jgi:pimeloyl-ACP methyl ester carboxylesterase